jgi:hypothetical protein
VTKNATKIVAEKYTNSLIPSNTYYKLAQCIEETIAMIHIFDDEGMVELEA